jgi:hypothetical protein
MKSQLYNNISHSYFNQRIRVLLQHIRFIILGKRLSSKLRAQLTVMTNFLCKVAARILTSKRLLITLEVHGQKCCSPASRKFEEILGPM